MLLLETLPPTVAELAGELIHRDGSVVWTNDQSVGGHRLTHLADPEHDQDAATKYYVDSQILELAGDAGDVRGPDASTDNALVRWDGVSGKLIQNSNWILSDAGKLQGKSSYSPLHQPTSGATITLDLNADNVHLVTLTQNATLQLTHATVGQRFAVRIAQDATGGRTLTWFPGVRWPGDIVPAVTPTAHHWDWYGFIVVGVNGYGDPLIDGFVLGRNYAT